MSKKEDFLQDLRKLLSEYDAEIEAKDHYQGYPECGSDIRMTVTFDGSYDELDLGSWFDKDKKLRKGPPTNFTVDLGD